MITDPLQTIQATSEWIPTLIYFFVAFLCGCIAATAELFSRYSHSPGSIIRLKESYTYLALNGIASLIAYVIIKKSGISIGPLGNSPLTQAIIGGLSAMAILRSSVASIKRGEATFDVGFAPLIQVFMDKVDRAFDRNRSQDELTEISKIMNNVDFIKAVKDLPTTCLNLMQHVSKEEGEKMGRDVADLGKSGLNPQAKSLNLGLIISRVTGPALLQSAVKSLGDSIQPTAQPPGVSGQQPAPSYEEERIKELKKKFL